MKPHDYEPHPERIWACQECEHTFADEVIRRDVALDHWGHLCEKTGARCESFLVPYMPEDKDTPWYAVNVERLSRCLGLLLLAVLSNTVLTPFGVVHIAVRS